MKMENIIMKLKTWLIEDIWWNIEFYCWTKPKDLFYSLRNYFKNIKKYSWFLWKDYDWDYGFMLEFMEFKLHNMSEYMKQSNIAEGEEQWARECETASRLLYILNNDTDLLKITDNDKWEFKGNVNTRNASRFLNQYQLDRLNSKMKKDFQESYKNDLYIEKTWNLLWKMISYKCRNWWD